MRTEQFLDFVAQQLVREMETAKELATFTKNSDLKGKYIEAVVRRFVRNAVHPFRVCTGSVLDNELTASGAKLRSIDTLIWAPNPVPALFDAGEFAMVPRSSAFGLLEIKLSDYGKEVSKEIADRTSDEFQRCYLWKENSPDVRQAIGVVCLGPASKELSELVDNGRAVLLFEEDGVRSRDVYRLVNFLAGVVSVAKREWATLAVTH
jgi:hypothetical protein